MTREMIVAAFGTNLATNTEQASNTLLPKVLSGRQLLITDRTGAEKNASLFFVSPSQINYLIPSEVSSLGPIIVRLTDGVATIAAEFADLTLVNPSIFSANADGKGVVAGVVVRVKSDGSQVYESASQYDASEGKSVSLPIDLGAETDRVFLGIFGTGFRFVRQVSDIKVSLGGIEAAITYVGPQFIFPGLDQINVEVPRSLIGAGEVDIAVTVGGNPANLVRAAFK